MGNYQSFGKLVEGRCTGSGAESRSVAFLVPPSVMVTGTGVAAIHLAAAPVMAGHRVPLNLGEHFTQNLITGRSHDITRYYTPASVSGGVRIHYTYSPGFLLLSGCPQLVASLGIP